MYLTIKEMVLFRLLQQGGCSLIRNDSREMKWGKGFIEIKQINKGVTEEGGRCVLPRSMCQLGSLIISHFLEHKRVRQKYPVTQGSDEVRHCQGNDNCSRQMSFKLSNSELIINLQSTMKQGLQNSLKYSYYHFSYKIS